MGLGPTRRSAFLHIPSGPAHVEVAIAGHRTPVRVVVDGVVEAVLQPGEDRVDFQVTVRRGRLDIVLETEGFVAAGGRRLGTQLRRVAVTTPGRLTGRLVSYFATGSLAVALGALAVGFGAGCSAALGSLMAAVIALTLWPGGAVWSGYAASLWSQVLALALLATLFARWQGSRVPGSGPHAFAAILIAGVVQGIWATHPAMVVSDAVFHANRLVAVAGGDLFPTSVTQHATPFHFPYGVSFYLLLAPFARAGIDPVWLVRWGAGLSGLVMSAGLFLLLRHRPGGRDCGGLRASAHARRLRRLLLRQPVERIRAECHRAPVRVVGFSEPRELHRSSPRGAGCPGAPFGPDRVDRPDGGAPLDEREGCPVAVAAVGRARRAGRRGRVLREASRR